MTISYVGPARRTGIRKLIIKTCPFCSKSFKEGQPTKRIGGILVHMVCFRKAHDEEQARREKARADQAAKVIGVEAAGT